MDSPFHFACPLLRCSFQNRLRSGCFTRFHSHGKHGPSFGC